MSSNKGRPAAMTEEVMRDAMIRAGTLEQDEPLDGGVPVANSLGAWHPGTPPKVNPQSTAQSQKNAARGDATPPGPWHPPEEAQQGGTKGVPNGGTPRGTPRGTPTTFTTRKLDVAQFRPVEFAWTSRLVAGVLNVLAGTEGIGKGTMLAWVIAQLTRGELPGKFHGKPARVLWVGDEDSWTHVVGPRLYAAGTDLARVEELISDDDRLLDVHKDAVALERIVTTGGFDVVVFEALLDHMPPGRNGDPTQHVRASLAPTRAVLRRHGTTALATMHTRKGPATSFRDLMAGSHQYNALSRSSLLLALHPEDENRRIVVAGKQNYSRAAITESFELCEHGFELNEHRFSVSLAQDFRLEEEITIDSLLAGPRSEASDHLREEVLDALTDTPQSQGQVARALGRQSTDGSVRRHLKTLEREGLAHKALDGWVRGRAQVAPNAQLEPVEF